MESAYFVNNSKEASFKLRLRTVFFLFFDHRRTGKGGGLGRGGLQPPQILGNSDFLGSERKFGQSQLLTRINSKIIHTRFQKD